MNPLYKCPEVLAFLQAAKESPDDDTPRLILADWLDDHDASARAEFIRLQCLLASATDRMLDPDQRQLIVDREEEVLNRHGGDWLGPLWTWRPLDYAWRRGLLALRLTRPINNVDWLEDVLPWIDSVHFEVRGRAMLQMIPELLNRGAINQVGLTFTRWFSESTLLDSLGRIQEAACLRTLTFWSVRPAGRRPAGAGVNKSALRPSQEFLSHLVNNLPLGFHLRHLGVGPALTPDEESSIRTLRVDPFSAQGFDWMK